MARTGYAGRGSAAEVRGPAPGPRSLGGRLREGDPAWGWVTGVARVEEALEAGLAARRLLADSPARARLGRALSLASSRSVEIEYVSPGQLQAICQTRRHQGVALELAAPQRLWTLTEVLDLEGGPAPLIIVCDSIADPMNLGAIMRSAVASGAQAAVLGKHHGAGLTPTVVVSSAGASNYLPICQVNSLAGACQRLRQGGFCLIASDAGGELEYSDVDFVRPCALLLGSEGKGVRPLLRERADVRVRIPIVGQVRSLNVAAAAAVLMFEAARQKRALNILNGALQAGGGDLTRD